MVDLIRSRAIGSTMHAWSKEKMVQREVVPASE